MSGNKVRVAIAGDVGDGDSGPAGKRGSEGRRSVGDCAGRGVVDLDAGIDGGIYVGRGERGLRVCRC